MSSNQVVTSNDMMETLSIIVSMRPSLRKIIIIAFKLLNGFVVQTITNHIFTHSLIQNIKNKNVFNKLTFGSPLEEYPSHSSS